MNQQRTVSPVDGRVYVERPLATAAEIDAALERSRRAQRAWRTVPVAERAVVLGRFCDAFEARRDAIASELTWQMGRPLRYTPGEVRGTLERARHMIAIAPESLRDIDVGPREGFRRFLRREPLGVVFTIAAWNYPYLIAVNSVVPALMAGNTVVLKHSAQTPLCAERFAECFRDAGLPDGCFEVLHLGHEDTNRVIADPRIDFVAFTGSVAGGHAIQRAAAERFIGTGLELGGCDPAYVRHDANVAHAIENLVDGAYFNSGQSCCGIQRVYVHERVYDRFVEGWLDLTQQVRARQPAGRRDDAGSGRPDLGRGRNPAAGGRVGRALARARRSRKASSVRASPARRTWRHKCCSTSITPCRSCATRSSGRSPASCGSGPTSKRSA